jgi:hypothetical protein
MSDSGTAANGTTANGIAPTGTTSSGTASTGTASNGNGTAANESTAPKGQTASTTKANITSLAHLHAAGQGYGMYRPENRRGAIRDRVLAIVTAHLMRRLVRVRTRDR